MATQRKFALIAGACSGIGYYLAKECAEHGCDLLIAADEPEIEKAAENLRAFGGEADMLDTKVGTQKKQDPRKVAKAGFDAMMDGKGDVVTGWQNVLRAAIATNLPAGMVAEQPRGMAEPGSAR